MKKITVICLIFSSAFLLLPGVSRAEYFSRAGEKLGRGVVNMTTFPAEITKAYEKDVREGHTYKLLLVSPARGLFNGLTRLVVGAYEVGTFFVPHGPLVKPAYVMPSIKEFFSENADGPS